MSEITNTQRKVYNAAHPYLVVDATKSRNSGDTLCWALSSLQDVHLIEYTGTIHKDGAITPVDKILAWRCPADTEAKRFLYNLYNVEEIVYLLDKIHVDLDLQSTGLYYSRNYADAECQFAPLFAFPEGFALETLSGNINNLERYTEMMRTYGNNVVAMGVSDHPKTDAPNANTGKEDN